MDRLPPILILAPGRTGSNLLKSFLSQDPRVLNLLEFLNPQPDAHHPELGFWVKHPLGDIAKTGDGTDLEIRVKVFRNYLNSIQEDHPDRLILADLKYNHIGLVDTLWRDADRTPAPLRAFIEHGAAIVHLVRRNPLAQLCSLRRALSTGVWVESQAGARSDEPVANRVALNPARVVDNLRRIELRTAVADFWLGDYQRAAKIYYEDLLSGDTLAEDVRDRILALVGAPLKIDGPAGTKKLAPALSDLIENYEAVSETLRGTSYEWCLEASPDSVSPSALPEVLSDEASGGRTAVARRAWPMPLASHKGNRRILFGSELGNSLRHLTSVARIGDDLREKGAELVYAIRDLGRATLALGPDATVLQAPVWPPHRQLGGPTTIGSYADLLTRIGFGDRRKLEAMVSAWSAIIDFVEPDLVIAQHSPALHLALYESRIPLVSIGTGFTQPPLEFEEFPPLRGDQPLALPQSRFLRVARQVQSARLQARPVGFTDIFRTPQRFIFGLPELDPYQTFRSERIMKPPGGFPAAQPWFSERRLFVELGADVPKLEALVQTLCELDTPIEAYFHGDAGALPDFLRMRGHTAHDRPPPLDATLQRASHILASGETLIAAAAFCAGRAQLIVPNEEESWQNLRQLKQLRTALLLDPQHDGERQRRSLSQFLANVGLSESAQENAQRVAGRPLEDAGAAVVEAITRRLSLHPPAVSAAAGAPAPL